MILQTTGKLNCTPLSSSDHTPLSSSDMKFLQDVDLLLGNDYYFDLLQPRKIDLGMGCSCFNPD